MSTHKTSNRVALKDGREYLLISCLVKLGRSVVSLMHTTEMVHPVTMEARINNGSRIFVLVNILRKNNMIEYLVKQSVKKYRISHTKRLR